MFKVTQLPSGRVVICRRLQSLALACGAVLHPVPPTQFTQPPQAPLRGLIEKDAAPGVMNPGFKSSLQCQLAE